MSLKKITLALVSLSIPLSSQAIKPSMPLDSKIWIDRSNRLVGSATVKSLGSLGYNNLILKSHTELDLCNETAVQSFYSIEQPDYVFMAAAHVGGILANQSFSADFIYNNLAIQNNVIHGAYLAKVKKLLFLGSCCIYPKNCPQPIKESYLLTSPLELTNEAYALIRKFIEAKDAGESEVVIWESGTPSREFLFVDDLAEAAIWAMNHYEENEWLNVGSGKDVTIYELATLISQLVEYKGNIVFDSSKPDGTHRKLLDVSKIQNLGGEESTTSLSDGLAKTIQCYQKKLNNTNQQK